MDPYNNLVRDKKDNRFVEMSSIANNYNNQTKLINPNVAYSSIVQNATTNSVDTFKKNVGNIKNSFFDKVGQIASFAMNPLAGEPKVSTPQNQALQNLGYDSSSSALPSVQDAGGSPVAGAMAAGSEAEGIADMATNMGTLGKAGDFIGKNAGAITSGFELGSDLLSYGGRQDKLRQTSNAIDKSIDILDNAKTEIGGANVENFSQLDSAFSENMQNNALQSINILKKNMEQVPTSNLSTGNIKQIALETQEAIKTKLTSLYQSQQSKNEDIKKRLNQSANLAITKTNSSIDKLEAEKKKIEEAQSNNKLNLALNAGKVAANFLPGGPVVGQVVGMGLEQFKQENEYS